MSVKRWNFPKAKWSHHIALTNKFAKTLLLPDSLDVDAGYQDFCNTIKKAPKKIIPRGYPNNCIPYWDAECEFLYKTFLQSPQGDDSSLAATALLAKLDRKRRNRWSEAVRSIKFSHSSPGVLKLGGAPPWGGVESLQGGREGGRMLNYI